MIKEGDKIIIKDNIIEERCKIRMYSYVKDFAHKRSRGDAPFERGACS